MAKVPKSETAIKAVIAGLVETYAGMVKRVTNIKIKGKSKDYVKAGDGTNLAVRKETIVFWFIVTGKPETDYANFETAIDTTTDNSFNNMELVTIREIDHNGEYARYYEIKVT
jgi:hypothetical protein